MDGDTEGLPTGKGIRFFLLLLLELLQRAMPLARDSGRGGRLVDPVAAQQRGHQARHDGDVPPVRGGLGDAQ